MVPKETHCIVFSPTWALAVLVAILLRIFTYIFKSKHKSYLLYFFIKTYSGVSRGRRATSQGLVWMTLFGWLHPFQSQFSLSRVITPQKHGIHTGPRRKHRKPIDRHLGHSARPRVRWLNLSARITHKSGR